MTKLPQEDRDKAVYTAHEAEYSAIRSDMARVLILNSLIFIGIIAIYYTDKNSGYLQKIYESLF